jgi:hypothetical protein
MRVLITLFWLVAAGSWAQDASEFAVRGCHAITGPPDITEDGTFARPEPTPDQCDAVSALVEKFLATNPRDFRRTVEVEGIPGNVRVSIGRIGPWNGPRPVGSTIEGDLPNKRHVVTWRTDKMTVVVYQTNELSGPATAVLIADQEGFRVCNFPRWPFEGDPRRISIEDIQRALREGLVAKAEFAACRLEVLPID